MENLEGLFFHECWDSKRLHLLEEALTKHRFVDIPFGIDGSFLLHRVVFSGSFCETTRVRFINLLLDAKADVNAQNTHKETPLHVALDWTRNDCAKTLLCRGANVNIADNDGMSAIFCAIFKRNAAMIRPLIDHGASLLVGFANCTPLDYALLHEESQTSAEIIYDACPTQQPSTLCRRSLARFDYVQQKRRRFRSSALAFLGVLRRRVRGVSLDMVRLLGEHMRATRFEEEWQ
jgi:ankyrin repeat protein